MNQKIFQMFNLNHKFLTNHLTIYLIKKPKVIDGKRVNLHFEDVWKIFYASAGASVYILGHGNEEIFEAMYKNLQKGACYLASTAWKYKYVF